MASTQKGIVVDVVLDPRILAGLALIGSEYGQSRIARILLAEIDANIAYRSDGDATDQHHWKIVDGLRRAIKEKPCHPGPKLV